MFFNFNLMFVLKNFNILNLNKTFEQFFLLFLQDFRKYLIQVFLKFYPIYHFLKEIIVLCYYMAYALNISDYHSLALHLTSTKLVPITLQDMDDDAWKTFIPKSQHG